jgi:hypothetical protein
MFLDIGQLYNITLNLNHQEAIRVLYQIFFQLIKRICFFLKQASWSHRYTPILNYISKFMIWSWESLQCKSRFQRSICLFSFRDLPLLTTRYELFANKFNLQEDPIVYQCLDKWLSDKEYLLNCKTPVNLYCEIPILKSFNNFTNC